MGFKLNRHHPFIVQRNRYLLKKAKGNDGIMIVEVGETYVQNDGH